MLLMVLKFKEICLILELIVKLMYRPKLEVKE